MEQSSVGKVLSSCDILPPMVVSFSIRYTLYPASPRSMAALSPAMPPPITMAVGWTSTTFLGMSWSSCALDMPAFTNSIAFWVASSRSC